MIRVTRLDGNPLWLNADFIQSVENTPDTLITLTTGFKIIVLDTSDKVVEAYRQYKRETMGIKVIQRTYNVDSKETL